MTGTRLVLARQTRQALADPGPSFVLPLMPSLLMLVVFTSVFDSLGSVAEFSTQGLSSTTWDAFVSPGVIMLIALLGGGYTSSSLASDIRSGYASRMTLAGGTASDMVLGRLAFEAVRLVPATALALVASLAVGGKADNGLTGIVVVIGLVSLLGVAFSGIFYLVAIATEDPQTPFTMQPLGLPLAFLSSALVPIAIMPVWSEAIAKLNPVTIVVDGARNAMIGQLWSRELLTAIIILSVVTILTQAGAIRLLNTKLEN